MSILGKEKKDEAKAETPPNIEPKLGPDGKLPLAHRKRRWGMAEYPETDFVRVTFLQAGGLSGERWSKGKSGDVPKSVFAQTLKPMKIAKLWEKPKPKPVAMRPATDVGGFRRR